MVEKAYINPIILEWARKTARMSEEVAAAKVSIEVDKYKSWEAGSNYPTIRQAQTLAKAFRRPFALFFLPEIPRDFQPLQDFRKKGAKDLSTSSVFIIREMQQKQAWISTTLADNNEAKLAFVGRFSVNDSPAIVADDILNTLSIVPGNYDSDAPIKDWINAAESKGVFISRASFINSHLKLDSNELQGFAIADYYAPFVFINSDDWTAPQLFTLVHELAHIWIAESGISDSIEPEFRNTDKYHPVELFCNEVAANALLPKEIVLGSNKAIYQSSKELFKAAKKLGVSTFSFLLRALKLNIIDYQTYSKLKYQADIDFQRFLDQEAEKRAKQRQKENSGGPDYYLLQVNRNGKLFTQTVLDAYRGGNIDPNLASQLLNVQSNKFYKLEAQLFR